MCAMSSSLFFAAAAGPALPSLPVATSTTRSTPTPTNDTMFTTTMSEEEEARLLGAPRMRPIDLPDVSPPYFIRASLAPSRTSSSLCTSPLATLFNVSLVADTCPSSTAAVQTSGSRSLFAPMSPPTSPTATELGWVDFSLPLDVALASLSDEEASRPATSPATPHLRIVLSQLHPTLAPIFVLASAFPGNGGVVTVYDVLSSIHAHLHRQIQPSELARFTVGAQTEAHLQAQERSLATGVYKDCVRYIDLLDGATVFGGLIQQEDVARRYIAPGERGIDRWQSVTWIMITVDRPRYAPFGQPPMGLGPYRRQR